MTNYQSIQTPYGVFVAVSNEEALMMFDDDVVIQKDWACQSDQVIEQLKQALDAYFSKAVDTIEVPIVMQGTPFQLKVWKEVQTIQRGEVTFYADIAKKINHPRAIRAVGSALKKCPFSFIIPCHRVISKSGKIGGYGHNIGLKARLLEDEQRRNEDKHEICSANK